VKGFRGYRCASIPEIRRELAGVLKRVEQYDVRERAGDRWAAMMAHQMRLKITRLRNELSARGASERRPMPYAGAL
jgi:hypothetical protein